MVEWLKRVVLKTTVWEMVIACNQLNSNRVGEVWEIRNRQTVVKLY
jgi:hypothetical protein